MKRSPIIKDGIHLFACLVLLVLTTAVAFSQSRPLPNPVLFIVGQEPFESQGKQMIRYRYDVDNSANYPDALFAPSPALPPCGANTKSSRTWIDIFDQRGKRLNGFCALGSAKNLNGIWFAMDADEVPPSWIYIEMNDRQTSTKYKSNLAETSQ
ncbi:MAG: hypothetical protein ABI596_07300 [Pyrinomonadaceae bacterium]